MYLPLFPGAAPSVVADYCLNRRFKQSNCARCQALCPVRAIQLLDHLPALDEASCVRCGGCLHVCPTEVFSQASPLEQRLVKCANALPETAIAVVCPLHPAPEQSTTPSTAVLRHARCLAGLGVSDLLAISRDGERSVWLDDSPCPGCPLASNQSEIVRHAADANALLAAAERPGTVLPASAQRATKSQPVKRPVVEGSQPRMSRRGLFASFLPATPDPPDPQEPLDPEPTRWSQGKRLPPLRRLLLRRLRRLAAPATTAATPAATPFRGVYIDAERCSACELCARFCPTDALHFVKDGAGFALDFEAARCVDCSICVLACPEDAVRISGSTPLAVVLGEPVMLVSGPLVACKGCGAPTAQRSQDAVPLCHACRQGAGIVRPLHDGAGLVADLLRRERLFSNTAFASDKPTHDDHTPA